MSIRAIVLLLVSACYWSCSESPFQQSTSATTNVIQRSTTYPNYWSWDGQTPVLLLGAGGAEDAFLEPDYQQKLNILADNGGNFTSVMFHLGNHIGKEDSLIQFLRAAEEREIAVELTIFCSPVKMAQQVRTVANKAKDLIQKVATFNNILYRLSLQDEEVFNIAERALPTAAVLAEKTYQSIQVKQNQGYQHWEQLQTIIEERQEIIPYNFNEVTSFRQVAAEGIAAFNRSVLAGAAAVRHRARPQGAGFSGPALSGIRAIRTLENHFNFWELKPAPHITPTAEPNEAYAMTDGNNGFLIYLPTAGSVFLQLDIKPQIPLRVSVVGYLGTQKSELLQPPYKSGFTLYTDEPRGGWMVIKPER